MHIDKNEDSLKKLLPYDSKYVTFWKRQYYGDGKKITGCQRFEGNEGMNRWNQYIFRAVKLFCMIQEW